MTEGTRLLVIDAVLPDDGTPHSAAALDVYWAMTSVIARRLTGATTPAWRDA
jgi:L-fucose isomerase-like protein